ncbi:MAG: MBOAT family protein [Oscillospiraceae bacterium]|nr:MBOAT family protein [Oscillospiraceae bacterium]
MSFDSLTYLLFLPAVVLLHWLCPARRRHWVLLAASLIFYASWNLRLTGLLLAVIGLSWLAGLLLARPASPGKRRTVLWLALGLCLAVLAYFKYFHFLAGTLGALLRQSWRLWDVVLPVGISFYTFQAMSYVIDVYRDPSKAERHPGYYALYISFFPQLVAGPIERAERLLPQLRAERRWEPEDLRMGLRLLLSGYFRKLVLADCCGRFVTAVYAAERPDGSAVFLATLLFAVQIYNDFAGYSEIALGSARLLGIRLMRNFDRPYLACGLRDFWRRWHISLTRWFTDYVYIPLGGSKRGLFRQIAATLLVFALSGLWHGANWTFLAWGLFHGALLTGELLVRRTIPGRAGASGGKLPAVLLTFLAVSFSWLFFRADSLGHAFALIGQLFSVWDLNAGLAALSMALPDALWLLAALLMSPLLDRLSRDERPQPTDMTLVYLALSIALAWLIRLEQNAPSAFIYFQF